MVYLLLSILFATGLFVIFKYFGIYKIDILKAIVINYIVALTIGFSLSEKTISILEIHRQPWVFGAAFLVNQAALGNACTFSSAVGHEIQAPR